MPIDYGWTGEAPPRQQSPQGQRSPTLAGTLNALGAGDTAPTGLVIPGAQNAPSPADPGVVDFNRLGRLGMSGVGAALSLPRLMAWNAGPALVGRSGQGPQTGAEALGRLGLDYESPGQRALGHGLGAGLDFLADPLMLGGVGAARGATPSPLAARLEQFAGPGLQDAALAAQARAAQPIAAQPGSRVADMVRRMSVDQPALAGAPSPMVSPQVSGRLNRAAGRGLGYQMGRSEAAHAAADMPNFPTALTTEQFMSPAAAQQSALSRRLESMVTTGRPSSSSEPFNVQPLSTPVGPPSAIQASTPTPEFRDIFAGLPQADIQRLAGEVRPGMRPGETLPSFTGRSPTAMPSPPTGGSPLMPPVNPPYPRAPATSGARGLPNIKAETNLADSQWQAIYQAMRNPARFNTLGPRSLTEY